jgi:GGDEF domain-containing protein
MVSIRDSLTELERLYASQTAVVDNYLSMLRDVGQYAVEISEEITPAFRRHMADVVVQLTPQADMGALAATRSVVRNELRDYRDRAAMVLNGLRRDLAEKVEALQAIVEAMASADGDHEERLQGAIIRLRKLADTAAAQPVRAALLEASNHIEASVEEVKRQNGLTIGQFMVEIRTLHKRIEALEMAGRKDVLTGLFSRVEMESCISTQIDGRNGFSLLLLRICNLPLIQRQFGGGIRADVISAFAKRMRGGLPENAVVGRWSEDRFLALLQIAKSDAMTLAKSLNQHVSGTYVCMENGKPQRPSLQVNVSVIDHSSGGLYESLIARINQL